VSGPDAIFINNGFGGDCDCGDDTAAVVGAGSDATSAEKEEREDRLVAMIDEILHHCQSNDLCPVFPISRFALIFLVLWVGALFSHYSTWRGASQFHSLLFLEKTVPAWRVSSCGMAHGVGGCFGPLPYR
jgi:hypothetical protein